MNQYFGEETKRSVQNFPFSYHPVALPFIYAIAEVKKAAAVANCKDGGLDKVRADAIVVACDAICAGNLDDQFVTCALQGGAGTSINMNVNEVVANYAAELVQKKGTVLTIHPLDHVNKSQSTNDVNPSALKLACLRLSEHLSLAIDAFATICEKKVQQYANVTKLGRTHLQDAVPTTVGAEFAAYAAMMRRDKKRITDAMAYLFDLNLGGTAIGNGINASQKYRDAVVQILSKNTGYTFRLADNLMAQTSTQTDFVVVSHAVMTLMMDLSKMANDIRFFVSGPHGGIGEYVIEERQKGSSIMPGKVNPVIPEVVNQTYFLLSGYAVTIEHAAHAAQCELANMGPILADTLLLSLKLARESIDLFGDACIKTLVVNEARCKELLERSTAYATLLTPVLGYDAVSKAVKEATATGKTIRAVIVEKKLLTAQRFDEVTKI